MIERGERRPDDRDDRGDRERGNVVCVRCVDCSGTNRLEYARPRRARPPLLPGKPVGTAVAVASSKHTLSHRQTVVQFGLTTRRQHLRSFGLYFIHLTI